MIKNYIPWEESIWIKDYGQIDRLLHTSQMHEKWVSIIKSLIWQRKYIYI
jgi:ABC-type cobalt transport system substrate-binding protein